LPADCVRGRSASMSATSALPLIATK